MSKGFDAIKRGLQEAIAHAEGKSHGTRMHRPRPVDVKALRTRIGMTQEEFAARFCQPGPVAFQRSSTSSGHAWPTARRNDADLIYVIRETRTIGNVVKRVRKER